AKRTSARCYAEPRNGLPRISDNWSTASCRLRARATPGPGRTHETDRGRRSRLSSGVAYHLGRRVPGRATDQELLRRQDRDQAISVRVTPTGDQLVCSVCQSRAIPWVLEKPASLADHVPHVLEI